MEPNNNHQERRAEFKEMVDTVVELSNPWKDIAFKVIRGWIITTIALCVVLAAFIWFAYMSPDTTVQHQDFTDQVQTQSSGTEVPANLGGE